MKAAAKIIREDIKSKVYNISEFADRDNFLEKNVNNAIPKSLLS